MCSDFKREGMLVKLQHMEHVKFVSKWLVAVSVPLTSLRVALQLLRVIVTLTTRRTTPSHIINTYAQRFQTPPTCFLFLNVKLGILNRQGLKTFTLWQLLVYMNFLYIKYTINSISRKVTDFWSIVSTLTFYLSNWV